MYPASASPRYIPGGTANTIICVLVAAISLILRFVLIRENKKLERAEQEDVDTGGVQAGASPEKRIVGFRYVH